MWRNSIEIFLYHPLKIENTRTLKAFNIDMKNLQILHLQF